MMNDIHTALMASHPQAFRWEIRGGVGRDRLPWCRVVLFRDDGNSPMHPGDGHPVLATGGCNNIAGAVQACIDHAQNVPPGHRGFADTFSADLHQERSKAR